MERMTRRLGPLLCSLLLTAPLVARQATLAPPDSLDAYIQRQMRERRIPGMALAIARNGNILTAKGYGLADVQNDVATKPDMRFDLASITKQFTAAGIMLLVEEKKVDLEASIAAYLPDVPDPWKALTVRHLLTHTSGLPTLDEDFTGFRTRKVLRHNLDLTTALMYDAARFDTLRFRPGEQYLYSDVGYFLLGMITEKASGMSWRAFVQKRIFEPLAMTESYVGDRTRIHKNEARGYTLRDGELINIRRVRDFETPSHLGIFSNVYDLVKWDAALYTDKLLTANSRAAMWTPVRLADGSTYPYGFGWQVWHQRGHTVHRHTGITGTEIVRLPDDGLVIIVLTNLGGQGPGINSWGIALDIAEMMIPALTRPPLVSQPINEADLLRFVGEFRSGTRTVKISIERGRLHVAPANAPVSLELVYQGNATFEVSPVDRRIVFDVGPQGEVRGFTLYEPRGAPPLRFVRTSQP
jgi:CubicO group peptidase (beta-lactamase class C family)